MHFGWAKNGMPRLLIVDDDSDSREGYAEYFTYLGLDVLQATTGSEALDLAVREQPDIVVLDMALPEMDGCEVLACLRADDRTTDTPVIILSACVFPRDRERAIQAGCDLFVAKPCSPEDIFREVERLLGASTPGA